MFQEEVREEVTNKGNCKDLISSKANKRALFISLGLMFFQQLCGINAVIFYAAEMFEIAETNLDSRICAIIVGVSQVHFLLN